MGLAPTPICTILIMVEVEVVEYKLSEIAVCGFPESCPLLCSALLSYPTKIVDEL